MNLRGKKIAFCVNSMEKGGAERVISIIANYLSKNNEVFIISLTNKEVLYQLDQSIEVIKLTKNVNTNKNEILNKFLLVFKIVKRTCKLKKIMKRYKFDIIISFLPEASFITMLSKPKCKVIISERNDPKIEYSSKIYKLLMHILYPKADAFVFQTADAKKYFEEIIDFRNKKDKIILNPVNEKFICNPYEGVRKKEIVAVGRLTKQKNFDLLLDAFEIVSKKIDGYKLIIYGEGEQREYLEKKIKSIKLSDKIKLPGMIDNINEKIYDSTLFVMSSAYEGMPNALIEAMVLGLPVIATDCPCGGPRTLIKNEENGILVNNNNKEELAYYMEKVLEDKELREKIGKNASNIVKIVNSEKINKQWENLIKEVLNK